MFREGLFEIKMPWYTADQTPTSLPADDRLVIVGGTLEPGAGKSDQTEYWGSSKARLCGRVSERDTSAGQPHDPSFPCEQALKWNPLVLQDLQSPIKVVPEQASCVQGISAL